MWQHVGRDAATLLVFYVSWCPVSRDFMLPYDLLRAEFEPYSDLLVAKVDGDENPNLVADFGVDEFPSILFFRRDCYWSATGCMDPMVWKRYNGTSNDVDSVSAWAHSQLLEELNENSFKQLPSQPDTLTGCKVDKITPLPADMREPLTPTTPSATTATKSTEAAKATNTLLQESEGQEDKPAARPACAVNAKHMFL